jgi:hypothetical protein
MALSSPHPNLLRGCRGCCDALTCCVPAFACSMFANEHLRHGIDIRTLQTWMGHRDIKSSMVYLKGVQSKDALVKVNAGPLAVCRFTGKGVRRGPSRSAQAIRRCDAGIRRNRLDER